MTEMVAKHQAEFNKGNDRVILNVGGTKFETSRQTMLTEPDTFFHSMLHSGVWEPNHIHVNDETGEQEAGEYFIDRDPRFFCEILNYLRRGTQDGNLDGLMDLHELTDQDYAFFKQQIDFFQIDSLLHVSKETDDLHGWTPLYEPSIDTSSQATTMTTTTTTANLTSTRGPAAHSSVLPPTPNTKANESLAKLLGAQQCQFIGFVRIPSAGGRHETAQMDKAARTVHGHSCRAARLAEYNRDAIKGMPPSNNTGGNCFFARSGSADGLCVPAGVAFDPTTSKAVSRLYGAKVCMVVAEMP
eukprot:TRINITY_DN104933_c0_g1_i1.p1 TRINITY_DN104933_c0_g1~~TRINITY_DN104933_c0_g1_i1.p1  ORF type:complete len:344 (-),score=29.73 TRINITY_DN104933_c0_g1_i1:139-1038(-)